MFILKTQTEKFWVKWSYLSSYKRIQELFMKKKPLISSSEYVIIKYRTHLICPPPDGIPNLTIINFHFVCFVSYDKQIAVHRIKCCVASVDWCQKTLDLCQVIEKKSLISWKSVDTLDIKSLKMRYICTMYFLFFFWLGFAESPGYRYANRMYNNK